MSFKRFLIPIAAAIVLSACGTMQKSLVRTSVPARPAGQMSALGMKAAPIEKVRVGFVGLGMRGSSAVKRFVFLEGASINALCDLREECVKASQKVLADAKLPVAAEYWGEEGWKQLCEREDIDLVYICTDWEHHAKIAVYAMEHGKHVAIEVPAATNMDEIWALVNTSERTRKHCMMLENCIYDFFELTALQMAREGLFGDIIHVEGAYCHNLDPFWSKYWNNWRLEFNKKYRGDLYPTHGIGPVCQALNIHRGDRMTTLVSMDTDTFNGPKHYSARSGKPCNDFKNGDVTTTMIRTAKCKTILIEHDVLTPRPYNRMYQLVGTDGYIAKYPVDQACLRSEGTENLDYENLSQEKVISGQELKDLMAKYHNPVLTQELEDLARKVGGHGGMDFIMDYRLIYCLNHGLPLDMDVYDLAEWCCLTELSRLSLENGSMPVEVPDFTRGEWDKLKSFEYAF